MIARDARAWRRSRLIVHGRQSLAIALASVLLAVACGSSSWKEEHRESGFEPRTEPVVRALRARDRAAADELVRVLEPSVVEGEPAVSARQRLHAYLRTHIAPAYLPLADDDAVREYMRVTIAEIEQLRDRSYVRCFAFLFGDRTSEADQLRLESTLTESTRAAGLQATEHLIASAGTVPVSIDEAAAWSILDNRVIPVLPAWLGERTMVLRDSTSRDIDRVAACEVTLAAYQVAVDLPAPEGPLVMRYLLARQMMAGL